MPRRTDITVEMVVDEYEKCPNLAIVAEKIGCSIGAVKYRLKEAGVKIVYDNQDTYRDLKAKIEPTERKVFGSKKEQAHYICTELSEPLAELLIEIRG